MADDGSATPKSRRSETEKETVVSEAELIARRKSAMSYEDPLSPVSSSGDSIATESDHHVPEAPATPRLSRTTSRGAHGDIVPISLYRTQTQRSTATSGAGGNDPAFEVKFDSGDKADPQAWPLWYKALIIAATSYSTVCCVLYSTSYTAAIPGMEAEFGVSDTLGVLGVTTYLLGMAAGAVILAPLSEMYGRRPIYIIALGLFVVFVIPTAVAKNFATILVVRFLGAFCAAAMISNAPGTVNDIVDDEHRALAFSIWSIGPLNGPVIGPVV